MMWVGMVLVVASTIGAAFSKTVRRTTTRTLIGRYSSLYTGVTSNHDSGVDVWSFQCSSLLTLCKLR